jgi:chemotaxis-related protein WspD
VSPPDRRTASVVLATLRADTAAPFDAEETCWNTIGVWGDRTPRCERLPEVIHCQNCEVYCKAGRGLLERLPSQEYLQEWQEELAEEKVTAEADSLSLVVFRLGVEYLALPMRALLEVLEPRVVRTLPHIDRGVFQGLVNLHGQMQLCVSLAHLVGIDRTAGGHVHDRLVHPRMMVIEKDGERWVFGVDEVFGIARVQNQELREVPVTVSHDRSAYTRGVFEWNGHTVGLLEDELVFSSLRRKITNH